MSTPNTQRQSPIYLPEILNLIFSHLPAKELAPCLAVSRLWFDCSVPWLYHFVRVVDFLKIVEAGRDKSIAMLGYFPVSAFEAARLLKYSPHITTLSCTSTDYRNRDARHEWKTAGRHFGLLPVDPLDQFATLLRSWQSQLRSVPTIMSNPSASPTKSKQTGSIHVEDLFPKLRTIRGGFDMDDLLGGITYMDFALPASDHFVTGITSSLQAAYTYNVERELRGTEMVLRVEGMFIVVSDFDPCFFFFLRRSPTIRSLELVMLRSLREDADLDWDELWSEDAGSTDVHYPPNLCRLRRLILRTMKPVPFFNSLASERMLGPTLPDLEYLFFGVEREVNVVDEWDVDSDDDGLHPFIINGDDDEMSDVEEQEVEEEDMTTDTDTSMDSDEESDDAISEGDAGEDDSMSEGSWQTEEELQVQAGDVEDAEAFLSDAVGYLPAYGQPDYRPPSHFSHVLRDGPTLTGLASTIGRTAPNLRVLGWDGTVRIPLARLGYADSNEEGRTQILEREMRKALASVKKSN